MRRRRGHPPPGGALQKAALEQVGLVDVFDRVRLLADRHRKGGQTHGPPLELLSHRAQDVAVEAVEALGVHLEQVERLARHPRVDPPAAADLGIVA